MLSCMPFVFVVLFAVLPGCYNAGAVNQFLQQPRTPVSGVEYRILPPDVLSITSIQVPEINGFTTAVRPDGKINVPLIGEVYVADRTPKQVEDSIKEAAKRYYEEVDATVQIAGYHSQKFYVFGEVSRPGAIQWTGCDTLLDVLAAAQPTALAWPERIIVIRSTQPLQGGYAIPRSTTYSMTGINPGPTGVSHDSLPVTPIVVPNEKKPLTTQRELAAAATTQPADAATPKFTQAEKMTINLMAMVQQGDMSHNILLKPGDIVYVQPNPYGYVAREFEKMWAPARVIGDGLSDFRQMTSDVRWIGDGMPRDATGQRPTIIAR